jgi:hypothetical protein
MKRLLLSLVIICFGFISNAQTPVNMLAQPGYTYTENFADLNNWTFNTAPANGTFVSGTGSAPWRGNDPVATGTIPDGVKITASTTVYQTGTSSGIYQQNQALTLLATGTTNNTTAVAMDLFLNFSGLNAGTISFDWASINNFTGDRKSSLKVYYSTNGTSFTEITSAAVANITNNSPTSGRVNFIALPAALNGVSAAQIRFYYYNGTGGTTGSRPKIAIDNLQVTGVPANACATPAAQATGLNLTPAYSSINGSFTAASPASDGYLVIRSTNNSLSSNPVDGVSYNIGDNVGDGSVISNGTATSFSSTSLSPSTTYYFFVFAMNHLCSGGTKYLTASPLTGNSTTLSGSSPCTAPSAQPTNLVFSNITGTSISGSFTASAAVNADHYLVVRSTNSTLSSNPVNGTNYYGGSSLGGGTVVTKTQYTTFTANNLASGIQYYFFVFAVSEDNCTGGPVYNTTSPLTGNATTTIIPACTTPAAQATQLNISATNNSVNGYFTAASNVDGYVVLYSSASSLTNTPQDGNTYAVGATIGNATVVANSTATSFTVQNLSAATNYYFYIFSKKDQCTGGPKYLTANPLQGSITTASSAPYGYYFGNLHTHTSYSDGNKDNTLLTPADAYTYAKSSQCMDYLGISEHNHAEAGMSLSNYAPGISQASAATTSTFLGLYGMEWGTISQGGHTLVYGINQLVGWETGNYNIFVAKGDYLGKPPTTGTTGLFKTVNDWPSTAVVMLAHPDNSDYGSIVNAGLNATADSAISGCAIESGPAFSTNNTYTDPATRLGYYSYYKKLLSRGYHAGVNIDHDTHYSVFGRSTYSRLAVISPTLTQADFLASVKARRFYATHDCDTKVSFTLNNQMMGSIATGSTAPAISIYVTDPTNPGATPLIRLMYGIAGSGLLPVAVDSINGNTFNYTDNALANNSQAYYFAEITIGGGYVITSPIWYTKSSVVPVTLLTFQANVTPEKMVRLNWRTVNETNNKQFVIERSNNGIAFISIDSVPGKNQSNENVYNALDKAPLNGLNYYRLRQVDVDGKTSYSNTVAVNLASKIKNGVAIFPNPVKDVLHINIDTKVDSNGEIMMLDAFGRIIKIIATSFHQGENRKQIDIKDMSSGTYYMLIRLGDERLIQKFVKL